MPRNRSALLMKFAAVAGARADQAAIIDDFGVTTYAELLADVRATARRIDRCANHPILALPGGQTREAIVQILAILWSGRAYLPLDPAEPVTRMRSILGKSGAIPLSDAMSSTAEKREVRAVEEGSELAYVLATSGSTGSPKIVPVTSTNALAFVDWASSYVSVTDRSVVASCSPLFFDLSVFNIFSTLSAGAAIVLPPGGSLLFGGRVVARLHEARVTHLYVVPSAARILQQEAARRRIRLTHLKFLMLAGEPFPESEIPALRALAPRASLVNMYGPVETNVVCAATFGSEHDFATQGAPIGLPASGAALSIRSDGEEPSEGGEEVGELLVEGPSVFRGYMNAETENPFLEVQGHRWYRTRDIVRRDPAGLYHFVVRAGASFKRNGFLVNPAEAEACGSRVSGVLAAATIAREPEQGGQPQLVLGVATQEEDGEVVRTRVLSALRSELPRYLWPDHVVVVTPPLQYGATGKVSRRSLIDTMLQEGGKA